MQDTSNGNYETALQEAEFVVTEYLKKLEMPKENIRDLRKIRLQYKKLKICSFLLGLTAIIGIAISILK